MQYRDPRRELFDDVPKNLRTCGSGDTWLFFVRSVTPFTRRTGSTSKDTLLHYGGPWEEKGHGKVPTSYPVPVPLPTKGKSFKTFHTASVCVFCPRVLCSPSVEFGRTEWPNVDELNGRQGLCSSHGCSTLLYWRLLRHHLNLFATDL